MKRKQILTAALLALLSVLAFSTCACATEIRPIPVDHDALDPGNGTFRFTVRSADRADSDGFFIAVLYLPDHYDGEQIRSLAPGDIVFANELSYTVSGIQIHDSLGSDRTEYEVYSDEGLGDECYLVFVPCQDGSFTALMNDWTPITPVGSVRVTLPLPDGFMYVLNDEPMDAQAFLEDLPLFSNGEMNSYNSACEFRNGQMIRVDSADYPYGPNDEENAQPVPVWKFCCGFRDGLDTAVITCCDTDCEEGLLPVEITPEEIGEIRRLAMRGIVTGKQNDMAVTGGTRVYSFETPGGKHLLSIELYRGLIVASDGMYSFMIP